MLTGSVKVGVVKAQNKIRNLTVLGNNQLLDHTNIDSDSVDSLSAACSRMDHNPCSSPSPLYRRLYRAPSSWHYLRSMLGYSYHAVMEQKHSSQNFASHESPLKPPRSPYSPSPVSSHRTSLGGGGWRRAGVGQDKYQEAHREYQ